MKLYFGDNLKVLQSLPDQSIDLIYADPPFNTGKNWGAYDDRWEDGLAGYLNFMRPRVEEIKRLLKNTGSFYLHCDPIASHYLKVMLDGFFGFENFRNEIVWSYPPYGIGPKIGFHRKHDTVLFYAFESSVFDRPYKPYEENRDSRYSSIDENGRRYLQRGNNRAYLDKNKGYPIPDYWSDIPEAHRSSLERTGYPTQKPIALLERIIKASSNEGDVVLDPFAGSGTTLDAAHGLKRKWIGIDEGKQSIETITFRLADRHGLLPGDEYELHGDTQDINLPTVEDATPQQINLL